MTIKNKNLHGMACVTMGKVPSIYHKTQKFVAPTTLFPGIPCFTRVVLGIVRENELLARVYIRSSREDIVVVGVKISLIGKGSRKCYI